MHNETSELPVRNTEENRMGINQLIKDSHNKFVYIFRTTLMKLNRKELQQLQLHPPAVLIKTGM